MSSTPKQFSYGGQAVIEGVMMRGAHKFAVAVRNPKGEIVIHEQPINATVYRGWIARTPFVRGIVGLWDALGLGTRALMWSADVALGEEENVSFNGPLGYGTLAVSLLLSVGLFFIIPTAAASGLESLFGLEHTSFLVNLLEGVVRLLIVVGYIWLIGRMADVKRLFGYHGAEHKTINAYEAGAELTPEVVQRYPIEHPRCGTAFLLTVVFVSVLVFSVFGRPEFIWLVISRILLVPVIAGIAYEFIRFTARHMDSPIIRAIIIPNLALQHLTTRQPDLTMIEVAIAAFKRVLVSEQIIAEEATLAPEAAAVQPAAAD
ncbi:MAG: DUF1385 domain-containing protein [Anaerolineae bacterium]|nr:DUF1385 domain-containing protein [Anaerolineae bacterium]